MPARRGIRRGSQTAWSFACAGASSLDGKILTAVQADCVVWSPVIRHLDMSNGESLKEWQFQPEFRQDNSARISIRLDSYVANWAWLSPDGKILATLETEPSNTQQRQQIIRLHD